MDDKPVQIKLRKKYRIYPWDKDKDGKVITSFGGRAGAYVVRTGKSKKSKLG